MIFTSVRLALGDLFSPPFRSVLWKSLGLTAVVLIALWFLTRWLFTTIALPFVESHAPQMPDWFQNVEMAAGWAAGLLLAVLLAYLIAPVSALIAGLFLDDVADVVEGRHYPQAPTGRAMPLLPGLWLSIKFLGVVIVGNLVAFALLLVPGINLVAFFLLNGYLLGREYFEFAAMRYRSQEDAKALRSRHGLAIFLTGLVIAGFLAIPIVNLLTPLFAAATMVHLHLRIAQRDGDFGKLGRAGADPAMLSRPPLRSGAQDLARPERSA